MGNSHVIFRSPVYDLFTPSSAVSNIPTLNYASTNLWTSSVARFAPLPLKTENVHSFPIFPINVKHAPINKNIWERCKTLHGETLTGGFRWRQVMESFPPPSLPLHAKLRPSSHTLCESCQTIHLARRTEEA